MSTLERNYRHLRAELAEIDSLLSQTPKSAALTRKSLEYRRSQVEAELQANPPPSRWPAILHLTFNGKPVVDREGIYADFAGKAVDRFTTAVTSLAASQLGPLGERGVIPRQEDYRLLVTGIAHGSFGFEIEEVQNQQATYLDEESPVETAFGKAKEILESLVYDDEAIAAAIGDTDDRALTDLRDFLGVMAEWEAVCTLTFRDDAFRFRDVGQVQKGLASLRIENLQQGERELRGKFLGFLPQSRRAEFREDQTEEVLLCQVDRGLDDAETINDMLGRELVVTTRFRQVGSSRPRYTITKFSISP